jgi:hypothetical protein
MTTLHYPTRESDGPAFVPVMLDLRQLRLTHARDTAAQFLRKARAARMAGDASLWSWHMSHAAAWRQQAVKDRS